MITTLLLLLLIPLLNGCVKIENTLDLSEIDSINNNFSLESKYIKKFPWQINFEQKVKDIFPDSEISQGEFDFPLIDKNLNIEKAQETLNKLQKSAGDLFEKATDLKINSVEKNFFFLKKHYYRINLDLLALQKVDDLELIFNIINPSKVSVQDQSNSVEVL